MGSAVLAERALLRSGAPASLRGAAGATSAARGLKIIENEGGGTVATIDKIDLHTLQVLHGVIIDDDIETVVPQHPVIAIDLIGEGHAKIYPAAPARRGIDPDTLDFLFHLPDEFFHLALGRACQTEFGFSQSGGG